MMNNKHVPSVNSLVGESLVRLSDGLRGGHRSSGNERPSLDVVRFLGLSCGEVSLRRCLVSSLTILQTHLIASLSNSSSKWQFTEHLDHHYPHHNRHCPFFSSDHQKEVIIQIQTALQIPGNSGVPIHQKDCEHFGRRR